MQQKYMNGSDRRQTTAMVQPLDQRLSGAFPPAQAIRSGTLFPELHKPMGGKCHNGAEICNERALAFSAWEMRLFLNTHPCNQQALKMYRQLCDQCPQPNYACAFAPCTQENTWRWVDDPWPWEYAANTGRD